MSGEAGLAHDLIPFPVIGRFAEVRMIYCVRCGATQAVESGPREPLGPCALSVASPSAPLSGPVKFRLATTVVDFAGKTGTFSADDEGVYFTEYLGPDEYGATQLVARPAVLRDRP